MELFLASDHAAFAAKEQLKSQLSKKGLVVRDLGPQSDGRCDYPNFAIKLARKIQANSQALGVLLCGSGVGVSMAANRFAGVRAALCRTTEEAVLAKEHNNANVLCLGGRVSASEEIMQMVEAWLQAEFQGERHTVRVALFDQLGEK
ncbi:MAG: ribose 5-phosphate isomerase B [Bdellovibrionales bacterium]|jgi:ribose 5-phosphate isomerase B|nr:ribose 5-phosphate isomerase B [Bdellovibrionales bacterium]MBT3527148.1 ribose 5-phosphate isomerase B [Bdellovibrionales bacterium]